MEEETKKEFSRPLADMSISEFFDEANEVLKLSGHKISYADKQIINFMLQNKDIDIVNLTQNGVKSVYFYSRRLKKYVPFSQQNFNILMSPMDYDISFLTKLFKLIDFHILTKMPSQKDAFFLHNIKFNNGTLIHKKKDGVVWSNDKFLSFNNIDEKITILDSKTLNAHPLKNSLMKYLSEIVGDKKNLQYFIDMLSSVFLPNAMTAAIFWIKSEGGKGKSSFFEWFSEILGQDNVANLKVDDFVYIKGKVNYNLPYLDGKLFNLDDDYSGNPISNSGFLKHFITGYNRVQVDYKQNQPISFVPKAQLFVLTNEDPVYKIFDSGDQRRNIVFPWAGKFTTKNFNFVNNPEFKQLFLSLLVSRALTISRKVINNTDTDSLGYFIDTMPTKIFEATQTIKTIDSEFIEKVNDFLSIDERLDEVIINGQSFINTRTSYDDFKKHLYANGDKMNYKTFLETLKKMELISLNPERKMLNEKRINLFRKGIKYGSREITN